MCERYPPIILQLPVFRCIRQIRLVIRAKNDVRKKSKYSVIIKITLSETPAAPDGDHISTIRPIPKRSVINDKTAEAMNGTISLLRKTFVSIFFQYNSELKPNINAKMTLKIRPAIL